MSFLRDMLSANKPNGMESSKKGNDWIAASTPICPGPA
jgi:hypothetical protein